MSFLFTLILCFVFLGLAMVWLWLNFRWEDFDICPICEDYPKDIKKNCPCCKGKGKVDLV